MPTDLEQQLARFAETLNREAPPIPVDGIVARGLVALDVDLLDRPSSERAAGANGVPWIGGGPGDDEIGERDVPIEFAVTVVARPPARRRVRLKVVLGAAAAAALIVAVVAVVQIGDGAGPADVPTTVPTSPSTTMEPASLGGMWPQATIDEVRAAQERADAGDPTYTWQVAPQLVEDYWTHLAEGGQVELVDRFIREVLGWEAYVFNSSYEGDRNAEGAVDGAADGRLTDQRFLRCVPGETNPLYPPQPGGPLGGSCAPTIDDLNYESVSLDLAQLDRQGSDGIWLVNRWQLTKPFAEADPAAEEVLATERLEEFLAARIAGNGAEGRVQVFRVIDIPLLYATTAGAPYERYEIERVDGPHWPYGYMSFSARLFADGDATVVEQQIGWARDVSGGLWLDVNSTTENGQPIVLSWASEDGEVTVSAPSTWGAWLPGKDAGEDAHAEAQDVWFGGLWHADALFGQGERIGLVDPVAYDAWCAEKGGSTLLSAPADAAEIAQQLIADPNFETTAPVAARIGGLEAISIDVALAPGGEACMVGRIEISRWIHEIAWDPGLRLRLYLVDLPEGMSVETLAITVVAPEERFDEVIEETKPIIDSIEFHPS